MSSELVDLNGTNDSEYVVGENETKTFVFLAVNAAKKDNKVTIRLVGRGASATIIGIVLMSADQQFSLVTEQLHEAPDTTSNLLVKSVLSGTAQFSYSGSIRVDKHAQKTDAYQRNENLLMDAGARATSKPSLEILANDVRCTHGVFVKTVDADQVWYMANRGITADHARDLIRTGFIMQAVSRISDTIIRENVRKKLGM